MNDHNNTLNGINIDDVDLYDFAIDNIGEENLVEEVSKLKVINWAFTS
jgi:hypothetical protein